MSEQKVRNTFSRIYAELERFHKVVRKGGLLEKNIMDIGGDPTYLQDMREHIDFLMNSLEDAERGALGHIVESHASNKNVVTEGVLDGDDEDGFMARSQLYFLARDAIQLHGMIDDRDNLEPWVQSKIAQSAQSIEAVRRYTEYNDYEDKVDGIPGEVDEGFSVLPNIDRERYQERDGLEGPFRTKSGKVVYYDPQEGAYYDPDTDFYLSYDEWKALDEAAPVSDTQKSLNNLNKAKQQAASGDTAGAMNSIAKADTGSVMYNAMNKASREFGKAGMGDASKEIKKVLPAMQKASDETRAIKTGAAFDPRKQRAESVTEGEERPYVCVHAKKGKYECSAESSYGAAKKAAKHWKLKNTAGIDAYLADKVHTAEGFASDAQRKAAFANGYDPDKKKKKNEATELVTRLKERAINELNLDPKDGWSKPGGTYTIKSKSNYKDNLKAAGDNVKTSSSYSDTIQQTDHAAKSTSWMQDKGSKDGDSETNSSAYATQDGQVDFYKVKDGKEVQNTSTYERPVAIAMKKQTQKALAGESINEQEESPVVDAIINRLGQDKLLDLVQKHGIENVMTSIDDEASFHGDMDEIGSSDVSAMVKGVMKSLGEGKVTEGKQLNEVAPLVIAGLGAVARVLGGAVAKKLAQHALKKGVGSAAKLAPKIAQQGVKNMVARPLTTGVGATSAGAARYGAADYASGEVSGSNVQRDIEKIKKYTADTNARKARYDAEMQRVHKELYGESKNLVKGMRKSLEERMIGELDVEFDDKKPSHYKAGQGVNSQSTSGKDRTKQVGSTFTQTQGNKEVGFDKFNADSKIGGVKQRNNVQGIHQQQGDEFSGTVRSTDSAAQGIDKNKFKTDTGYDMDGLKKARKAEFDKNTTKQKLKYSDKDSYQSGLGIEKDVADLKNMFNN